MIASPIFEPDNLHKATFNCKQHFFIQNYFLVIFQNSKNLRQSKCISYKTIVRQLPSESQVSLQSICIKLLWLPLIETFQTFQSAWYMPLLKCRLSLLSLFWWQNFCFTLSISSGASYKYRHVQDANEHVHLNKQNKSFIRVIISVPHPTRTYLSSIRTSIMVALVDSSRIDVLLQKISHLNYDCQHTHVKNRRNLENTPKSVITLSFSRFLVSNIGSP